MTKQLISKDQIKDLVNLYDIKYLSQAIADRGWAFMCHTTRQDLAKANVPTIYNDVVNKLNNSEKEMQSLTQLSLMGQRILYSSTLNKWFYSDESNGNIYVTDNFITSTVYLSDTYITEMICGNNIFLAYDSVKSKYIVKDLQTNETKNLTLSDIPLNSGAIRSIIKDNYIYVCPIARDNYTKIYKFYDDYSITNFQTITFSKNIYDIQYDNGYWYVLLADGVYKGTDINTPSSFTRIYQDEIYDSSFLIVKDDFSCFLKSRNFPIVYTYDLYQNVNQTDNNFDILYSSAIPSYPKLLNNLIWTNNSELKIMSININDFSTFVDTTVYDIKGLDIDYNNDTIVYGSSDNMYFTGLVNKQFTDTYNINGNSVVINYYAKNDFKICLADNTNDTNLATVYSYLGYYNYYRLDTTNETVSLPRNSNLYSMMYVGDNYQDTIDGITGNITRLLPQAEVISDSSTSVSLNVKGNKDYQLINSALTSLTITTCEDSQLGTTIQFNSGATATIITDSANINWVDGSAPTPSASKTCLIFIWNNKGFYKEW